MSHAPPLPSSNHFSVLQIHNIPDVIEPARNDEDTQSIPALALALTLALALPCRPKWEKKLASKLVIQSLKQGPNSILIPVHLKTMDALEEVGIDALVDCGATGDFIDEGFVE